MKIVLQYIDIHGPSGVHIPGLSGVIYTDILWRDPRFSDAQNPMAPTRFRCNKSNLEIVSSPFEGASFTGNTLYVHHTHKDSHWFYTYRDSFERIRFGLQEWADNYNWDNSPENPVRGFIDPDTQLANWKNSNIEDFSIDHPHFKLNCFYSSRRVFCQISYVSPVLLPYLRSPGHLRSADYPQFTNDVLFVWGRQTEKSLVPFTSNVYKEDLLLLLDGVHSRLREFDDQYAGPPMIQQESPSPIYNLTRDSFKLLVI